MILDYELGQMMEIYSVKHSVLNLLISAHWGRQAIFSIELKPS